MHLHKHQSNATWMHFHASNPALEKWCIYIITKTTRADAPDVFAPEILHQKIQWMNIPLKNELAKNDVWRIYPYAKCQSIVG